jgi:hypothetical protein
VGHESPIEQRTQLVEGLLAARQQAAAGQAAEARVYARAVEVVSEWIAEDRRAGRRRSDAELPLRDIALEMGMAIRVSDRTVQARMGESWSLVTRFSATLEAWEVGRIDAGHAWVIVRAGTGIASDADRVRFEELALVAAETESVRRFTDAARAIAAAVDTTGATERLRTAYADRAVRVYGLEDGMARLVADLPAPLAFAIRDRLTELAKAAASAREDAGSEAPDSAREASPGSASVGAGSPDTASADTGSVDMGSVDGGSLATTPADLASPDAVVGSVDTASVDTSDPVSEPQPVAPASSDSEGRTRVITGSGADAAAGRPDGSASGGSGAPCRDTRTIDQTRADMLAEMLLTGEPSSHGDGLDAVVGHVQVTVPALTLAGVAAEPALLAGYGPIDPSFARRLAASAPGWDRVFTDPRNGLPLAVDRYRPTAHLLRFLEARDERCRTPTCAVPAFRCDKDHTIDAATGGPTDVGNLADACRRHHVGKHGTAWTVRQCGGGIIEWTSPAGRSYRDRPPAVVRFVPAEDAPPF